MPFLWTCPFCDRDTTITDPNFKEGSFSFTIGPSVNCRMFKYILIVCPNSECLKFTFSLTMHTYQFDRTQGGWVVGDILESWNLVPPSSAKVFPDYGGNRGQTGRSPSFRQSNVRFLSAIYDGLERIARAPQRWPRHFHGTRLILHRFPFSIIHRDEPSVDSVNILATAHHKRKPGYWKNRM